MASADSRPAIWAFDNPRTCSQLLHRFFKLHPQLEARKSHQWAIHATMAGPERIQTRFPNRPKAQEADRKLQAELLALFPPGTLDIRNESYAVAAERLASAIEAAQAEGRIPYVKEHIACLLKPSVISELLHHGTIANPPNNPTSIPDHLFANIQQPLFLIRHPALSIPSFYREQLNNFGYDPDEDGFRAWTMQRSTRWFFEYLRAQGRDSFLIDAEDVVFRSEALCLKLCKIWNIEPEGLTFEWEARSAEKRMKHPLEHFAGTLEESKGIVRPEQMAVDIDIEQSKWAKEFGEEVATALRNRADADMPDYLYMQQYLLQLDG